MTETSNAKHDSVAAARTHAWEWFKFHAAQRLIVFNFFLIMTAATVAGFVTTFSSKNFSLSAALAILQFIIVIAFYNLDRRNSSLVKLAERYLANDENNLSRVVNDTSIKFIELSETIKPNHPLSSFRTILRVIFLTLGTISLLLLFVSIYSMITTTSTAPAQMETSL